MDPKLIDVEVEIRIRSTKGGEKFEDVVMSATHYGVETAYLGVLKGAALSAAQQLDAASLAAAAGK